MTRTRDFRILKTNSIMILRNTRWENWVISSVSNAKYRISGGSEIVDKRMMMLASLSKMSCFVGNAHPWWQLEWRIANCTGRNSSTINASSAAPWLLGSAGGPLTSVMNVTSGRTMETIWRERKSMNCLSVEAYRSVLSRWSTLITAQRSAPQAALFVGTTPRTTKNSDL